MFANRIKWALVAIGALSLGACASVKQTGDLTPSGFLEPDVYGQLAETDDPLRAGLGYINPSFDVLKYDKMLLDPVVSFTDQSSGGQLNAEDAQALANNFYAMLATEFGQDYQLVTSPQAGALRMKVAIVKATKQNVTMDTVSTIVPVGNIATQAVSYVTNKPVFNGELKIEFEVRDSLTRELFGAGVDSRAGGKVLSEDQFNAWSDVNKAMDVYAKGMRYRLCLERGGSDCQPPALR